MLIMAILFTLLAFAGGFIIVMGNGMSDSPSTPFQGGGIILTLFVIAIAFWVMWLGGWHFTLISR